MGELVRQVVLAAMAELVWQVAVMAMLSWWGVMVMRRLRVLLRRLHVLLRRLRVPLRRLRVLRRQCVLPPWLRVLPPRPCVPQPRLRAGLIIETGKPRE